MATSTAQRVGIWVIAVALVAGTLLGFVAMMIAPANEATDQQKSQEEYAKQLEEYKKQAKAAAVERAKTSRPLKGYNSQKFDAKDVKKIQVTTLKNGTGKELTGKETIMANYFGWTPDGKIFDSSNQEGKTEPIEFNLDGGVVEGFTKGLTGTKVGSVVRLTLPADQAYGSTDNGDGRPVGPLQFIVEVKEIK